MAKFVLSGETITDTIRFMYWDEKQTYNSCLEKLMSMISSDDSSDEEMKQIACDVIEGRSKFCGIDNITLEPDNQYIRLMSDRFREIENENFLKEVDRLLDEEMYLFIDPITIAWHYGDVFCIDDGGMAPSYNSPRTYYDCIAWLHYKAHSPLASPDAPRTSNRKDRMVESLLEYSDEMQQGLWLHEYPDVVAEALKIVPGIMKPKKPKSSYKLEFWDAVYDIIIDDSRFQSEGFKARNSTYKIYRNNKLAAESYRKSKESRLKAENDKELRELKSKNQKASTLQPYKETMALVDKFLKNHKKPAESANRTEKHQYETMALTKNYLSDPYRRSHIRPDEAYYLTPDDYIAWEGLIAPNGDFYSCSYATHNMKARNLLYAYPEKFKKIDNYDSLEFNGFGLYALDTIIENGWCATRWIEGIGYYITLPPNDRVTKAQKEAIYEAKIRHNIDKIDLSAIGY